MPQNPSVRRGVVVAVCVVLGLVAVGVALWLARPADEVMGTLIRVESMGRADRVVTAEYEGDSGHRELATYTTGLGHADGNKPGAPVIVYLRDGVPVDQPPPLLTVLGTSLLIAFVLGWALVWLERRTRGDASSAPPVDALDAL